MTERCSVILFITSQAIILFNEKLHANFEKLLNNPNILTNHRHDRPIVI